jgi:ribosomal protein S27E
MLTPDEEPVISELMRVVCPNCRRKLAIMSTEIDGTETCTRCGEPLGELLLRAFQSFRRVVTK